jgi:hypothetical protein
LTPSKLSPPRRQRPRFRDPEPACR